jgi:hypothetical protein
MDKPSVKFMIAKFMMSAEIDELEGLSLINLKETQTIVTRLGKEEGVVSINVTIMNPSSGCEIWILIILLLGL